MPNPTPANPTGCAANRGRAWDTDGTDGAAMPTGDSAGGSRGARREAVAIRATTGGEGSRRSPRHLAPLPGRCTRRPRPPSHPKGPPADSRPRAPRSPTRPTGSRSSRCRRRRPSPADHQAGRRSPGAARRRLLDHHGPATWPRLAERVPTELHAATSMAAAARWSASPWAGEPTRSAQSRQFRATRPACRRAAGRSAKSSHRSNGRPL